jgi:hypothetical protein
MSDTGRFAVGPAGSLDRALAERKAIVDAFLEIAVGKVKAELDSGWIGPEHSPLGELAHRAAVERRIFARRHGDTSPATAAIVAGRHLLTIDAMCDEYFRAGSGQPSRARAVNDNGGRR